jgi:hypothetical protein
MRFPHPRGLLLEADPVASHGWFRPDRAEGVFGFYSHLTLQIPAIRIVVLQPNAVAITPSALGAQLPGPDSTRFCIARGTQSLWRAAGINIHRDLERRSEPTLTCRRAEYRFATSEQLCGPIDP